VSLEHAADRAESAFGCTVHRRGLASTIELTGELDLAAKPTLDAALEQAIKPGPVETVVVDMTHVEFADSTTLAWLLAVEARLRDEGGRLVGVTRPGPVLDLLQLTGLDRRLTLVADDSMR
jgi:anti-sigma B factor antagonist